MAWTSTFNINDFSFDMNGGMGQGDGVVIDPSAHDLNAPGFIEALKEAMELYPVVSKVYAFEHYALCYANDNTTDAQLKNHFYSTPDDHINDIIRYYEAAQKQTIIEVTDVMRRYGEAAIYEKGRQAARAAEKARKLERAAVGRSGYVYLVASPTGAYKIGRTVNPDSRLKTFSVKLPFEVEYVVVIPTPNMYALESDLHKRFADKRVNGEWFNLTPEDVEEIKGFAS